MSTPSIIQLIKIWFLEFLNALKDHIFVLLKECTVETQISVFKITTPAPLILIPLII